MTNTATTVIPSSMRLAFERAWARADKPFRGLGRTVKGALNRRLGISYRKRMWSVERAKR